MRFLLFCLLFSISTGIFAQANNYVPNEVLIRFEPQTDVETFLVDFRASEPITFTESRNISPYLNIWHVKYDGNIDANRLIKELWQHAEVNTVQVNHILEKRILPNDPLYNQQWQWDNISAGGAWDINTGGLTANGDTIVVAIIDDGTQLDHPDLQANIWHNYAEIPNNGIDDDNNGFIDDFNGWNIDFANNNVDVGDHGINCAGMVGAVGNDGNQGVGLNWNVKLMTVVGGGGVGQEAAIVEAYSYVLGFRKKYNETNGAEGAFVVATNSSWGSDFTLASEAPLWCAFFDSLGVEGILSCGATSNSAYDVDVQGDLPTACSSDYLISVTATDVDDKRNFSAWGLETIDVAAPGDNIYTTDVNSGYTSTSGTSFATPLTAGLVALLYSAPCADIATLAMDSPDAAALLVKSYILDGVDKTDQLQAEIKSGGRVNAETSMQMLLAACGACVPPFGVAVTDLTDVAGTLAFTPLNDGVNLKLTNDAGSETFNDITSPFQLTNLVACTNYEVSLTSICADSTSQPGLFNFTTDGCCDIPDSFQIVSTTAFSTDLSWHSVLAANSYTIEYAKDPFTSWTAVESTETSVTVTNLEGCTTYKFRIRTNCDGPEIQFSEPISKKTLGCGACTDLPYCEIGSSNNTFEWIDSLDIEDVFMNTSAADENGYSMYPEFDISLIQGEKYNMTIAPGYSGFVYSEYIKAWIDFNQNGLFEENEVILGPDFSITEPTTQEITISPTALVGYTRMRVILSFAEITDSESCNSISFGEIEDYCVNIKSAEYCVGPDTIIITKNQFSAGLNWADVENSISYVVKYHPVGEDWESYSTATSDYMFPNLEACSNYEAEVQAICMDGIGLKKAVEFKTDCANGTTTPFGENSFTVRPNPFTENFEVIVHGMSNQKFQVRLFDLLGRNIAVDATNIGGQSMAIKPVDEIHDGVYLLQLKTDTHSGMIKVIKQ